MRPLQLECREEGEEADDAAQQRHRGTRRDDARRMERVALTGRLRGGDGAGARNREGSERAREEDEGARAQDPRRANKFQDAGRNRTG